MNKPKLFVWCDFLCDTGFGIVAENLLDNMHEDYDVTVLGINNHGYKKYDTTKYFVYPIHSPDILGTKALPKLLEEEQPDLIFLFQDIFHISAILKDIRQASPQSKVVIYFPVDGTPVSIAWKNLFDEGAVDSVITYTDWAIDQIKQAYPDIKVPIHKLYHGVNNEVFYPHAEQHVDKIRKDWGWQGKFVACNVNRFQPRKAIPLGLRAFSMFAKGYKVCKCGNWMPINRTKCDINMCPEEDIVEVVERDRKDVMLYLHMMAQERGMGPGNANFLQSHLLNAGFEDADLNNILQINKRNIYKGEVPNSVINDIYNGSNVNISTTLGEGAGLSLLESAACGTPSIAPKNSAVPEMLNGTGTLVKNTGVLNQALDNAHIRPIVDIPEFVKALDDEYEKWKATGKEKVLDQSCIENINENFQWTDKVEFLKGIFKDALN
jgi:D-inositol-3-phosphate glycosyltransferase